MALHAIPTDAPYTTNKFQWFTSDPPSSSFKKLVVPTLRLLRNLHMMSLAKAVPDSLKNCKCKKIALQKCPLIPDVPKKDCVQEMVFIFQGQPSQDADWQRYRTLSIYLALQEAQSTSHSLGICVQSRKRILQGPHQCKQDLCGATQSGDAGECSSSQA